MAVEVGAAVVRDLVIDGRRVRLSRVALRPHASYVVSPHRATRTSSFDGSVIVTLGMQLFERGVLELIRSTPVFELGPTFRVIGAGQLLAFVQPANADVLTAALRPPASVVRYVRINRELIESKASPFSRRYLYSTPWCGPTFSSIASC